MWPEFIKLTDHIGETHFVNINHIVCYRAVSGLNRGRNFIKQRGLSMEKDDEAAQINTQSPKKVFTLILLTNEEEIYVKETTTIVGEKIKKAIPRKSM